MKIRITLFIYLFLITICFSNCNIDNTKNRLNIVIPDSIYSFFPKKDSLSLTLYATISNAGKRDRIGDATSFSDVIISKMYSCEHVTQFELLMHKYRQEAIDSIRPTEDNYFIVKHESEMLKMYDYKTLKEKYQESVDKYILPSFHNDMRDIYGVNYNFTTVCGLPEDYEILIMKSGRNYILPENDIWKFDWKLLPSELKHGYTSGIAYRNASDKIIYWSIAW